MTNKIALIVAVVLGVFSILLVKRYIDNVREGVINDSQPVSLLVARAPIVTGEELTDAMVERRKFPSTFVAAVETAIPGSDLEGYLGMEVLSDVGAGQVLQRTHFRSSDALASWAPVEVEPGWRAVTIPVDAVGGLSAMLRPGDYVDVYAFFEITMDGRQQPVQVSHLLMHKVLVKAIDNLTKAGNRYIRGYQTVTVRVEPDVAPKLIHASQRGRFQLVKMSNEEAKGDHERVAAVTTETLFDEIMKDVDGGVGRGNAGRSGGS